MKKPYNEKYLCPLHKEHGEIAATCERCYSSAIGQQRRQWEKVREVEHEKYVAKQMRKAA